MSEQSRPVLCFPLFHPPLQVCLPLHHAPEHEIYLTTSLLPRNYKLNTTRGCENNRASIQSCLCKWWCIASPSSFLSIKFVVSLEVQTKLLLKKWLALQTHLPLSARQNIHFHCAWTRKWGWISWNIFVSYRSDSLVMMQQCLHFQDLKWNESLKL